MVLSGCSLFSSEDDSEDPLLAVFDNSDIDHNETEASTEDETADASANLSEFSTENLVSGTFYVRHLNNTCEEVYLGDTTFDGPAEQPKSDRICWFKEDFENIPTLYEGESLILYSIDAFDEEFNIERFEDFGNTFGIQGLKITPTGRLLLSTDVEDQTTYPMSEADEIINNAVNEYVILEMLGNKKLREDPEADPNIADYSFITRAGTFKELDPTGQTLYELTVYDGTIKSVYKVHNNIRTLASMELQKTLDYEYESKDVIHINIPVNYKSGYYMINGIGMFRYVAGFDVDLPIEQINFNEPNVITESSDIPTVNYGTNSDAIKQEKYKKVEDSKGIEVDMNMQTSDIATITSTGKKNDSMDDDDAKEITSNVKFSTDGMVTIHVSFTVPSSIGDGDGLEPVDAYITSPTGEKYKFARTSDGELELSFSANRGSYTIEYENLDVRVPHVQVLQ